MIFAVVSNKGGAGKTTVAFHCLPSVIEDSVILEIDDNNDTSGFYTNSKKLEGKCSSVKVGKALDAFDEITMKHGRKGRNIIVDAGGSNDSISAINLLKEEAKKDDLIFLIPVMPNLKQFQNALDTYKMVEDYKVIFILNGGSKEDFVFWYGDESIGEPSVDDSEEKKNLGLKNPKKSILSFPTAIIPNTRLFDHADRKHETIADLAMYSRGFESAIEVKDALYELYPNDDQYSTYKQYLDYYRLSAKAADFIDKELDGFSSVIKGVLNGRNNNK